MSENYAAWDVFTDQELKDKRTALADLVAQGTLMHRTTEREQAEIAIIDALLERRAHN